VDFATFTGLALADECVALHEWRARVSARPSANA